MSIPTAKVYWNTGLTSAGGSLDKLGGGTLTLNVANTYTGTTAVNGGKLYLNNTDTSSAINVAGALRWAASVRPRRLLSTSPMAAPSRPAMVDQVAWPWRSEIH